MSNNSKRGLNDTDKKRISSLLALLSFTAYMPVSSLPAFAADIAAGQLPDLNKAANGFTETSGNTMNVVVGNKAADGTITGKQGTVAQFDWNTFNVGKDATVNFAFTANSQTSLNRVLNSGGMSYIYGKLTNSSVNGCAACVDTSKVILINPSGILFGNGSSVNLNSLTASTYDIKGAQDLRTLSGDALSNYVGTGGKTGLWNIAGSGVNSGETHKVEFVANDNMVNGSGYLTGDATGVRLASIKTDNAKIKGDKTVAFVGNDIDITNNTALSTHYDSSLNLITNSAAGTGQVRAGVKLVTGDGVNFYYTTAGSTQSKADFNAATHNVNKEYGISIEDSTIQSGGRTTIYTGGKLASGSINNNLKIKNSTVFSKKLKGSGATAAEQQTNGTDGNIEILARSGNINIDGSNVQTTNDIKGSDKYYTKDLGKGKMTIQAAAGDINITNSQIRTADSTANASSVTAGEMNITANNGNVNITKTSSAGDYGYGGTSIVAAGDLTINAKDVNIQGYDKIQAAGNPNINSNWSANRTVKITAKNNINAANTLINSETVNLNAANALTTSNAQLQAVDSLIAKSANTKFDNNSKLSYNNISLYDDSKTSNVTFANGTTVHDKTAASGDHTLRITTNGNLTIDNDNLEDLNGTSTSKYNAYTLTSTNGNVNLINGSNVKSANGNAIISAAKGAINVNDSTFGSTKGNVTLSAKDNITVANANGSVRTNDGNITLTSTAGSVVANNNSRVQTEKGNVNVNANQNVNVQSGARIVSTNGTNNLTATNGKLTVTGNSQVQAVGGNMTVTQGQTMNMDTDINNGTLATSGKLTINTTNGGFTSTELKGGTGTLGSYTSLISLNNGPANAHFIFAGDRNTPSATGRLTINSKGDITSTGIGSTNYVDFNSTSGNINLTNTKTGADANVLLQNTTTNARGTTNISTSNGTLRTNNYDIIGGTKTTLSGASVKTDAGSDIDTKGNKLALNAPGSIDVTVRGMDKTRPGNGLEVNADLDTHINQDVLTGRTVKIKAADDDGNLVISKVKADTLDLVADHIYAGTTTIDKNKDHVNKYGTDSTSSGLSTAETSNKAYIEVKTAGGFNLDKSSGYDSSSAVKYNSNKDSSTIHDSSLSEANKVGGVYEDKDMSTVRDNTEYRQTTKDDSTLVGTDYKKGDVYQVLADKEVPSSEVKTTGTHNSETMTYDGDDPQYAGTKGHWVIEENERKVWLYDQTEYHAIKVDTYNGETRTNQIADVKQYQDYKSVNNITEGQHVATLDSSQDSAFVLIYDKSRVETDGVRSVEVGTTGKTAVVTEGRWGVDTNPDHRFTVETPMSTTEKTITEVASSTTRYKWVPEEGNRTWCKDAVDAGDIDDDNTLFVDDVAATVKLVRKSETTSDLTPMTNNKVMLNGTQVAAAAQLKGIDDDEEENSQEDDYDTTYDY